MKITDSRDLYEPFEGLHEYYVKLARKAGYTVDVNSVFKVDSLIVSEDIAAEIFKKCLLITIGKYAGILKALDTTKALSENFENELRMDLASMLDDYGPKVDTNLPMHTIILLDGFVADSGSIEDLTTGIHEYLQMITVPNDSISTKLN